MNVAAGPKLAAAVTNAGAENLPVHVRNAHDTPPFRRRHWCHWWCPPEPQDAAEVYRRSKRAPRGQERTLWRRSSHSAGRRKREKD